MTNKTDEVYLLLLFMYCWYMFVSITVVVVNTNNLNSAVEKYVYNVLLAAVLNFFTTIIKLQIIFIFTLCKQ